MTNRTRESQVVEFKSFGGFVDFCSYYDRLDTDEREAFDILYIDDSIVDGVAGDW